MDCTVHSGIHTLSFSKALTGKAYYRILHKAQKKEMQIETDTDYFDPSITQTLLGYQKHGIVIYLSPPANYLQSEAADRAGESSGECRSPSIVAV